MADAHKYQAHEVLNRVLNSGEDALNVDIDNVTLTTEGGDVAIDVALDKANDSVTIYANTAADGSGTNTVPLVDAAGNLQIDIVSSALPSGGATAANQSTIIGHVDGIETLITSTNSKIDTFDAVLDNILTKNTEIDAVLDTIKTDTQEIEEAVETIEGAVSGGQMQVDVVASLPAGSAAIGKLAANSGVDIGDVDILSIAAGDNNIGNVDIVTLPASTNTIEVVGDAAEDAAVAGNPLLAGGRYDATQRTLDDGDAGALALDPSGALYTREYTGQDGAVYTTASSDVIVPPTGKAWVAIQMLEDTTFDSSGGLIAVTATKWFNTEDAAGDLGSGSESTAEGSGGKQISNSITFPQGMTIFGRWSGIDVNSGSVIAYIGDY